MGKKLKDPFSLVPQAINFLGLVPKAKVREEYSLQFAIACSESG
jgi:hypothetical protein